MMVRSLFALALALGAPQKPGSLTGTWEWGDFEHGGGELLVDDEGSQVSFQLQLGRGAPSYNMGFLEGQLNVKDGKGTYHSREYDMDCDIAFEFQADRVVVRQTGSDAACGFGHAVSADGTYRRTSRKKPVFREQP